MIEAENRESGLTEAEADAGFTVQTLTYAHEYELPRLGDGQDTRLERAVAMVVDERNRIKRRRTGAGYVHEVIEGEDWAVKEEFGSLEGVLASDIWRKGRQALEEAEEVDELEEIN